MSEIEKSGWLQCFQPEKTVRVVTSFTEMVKTRWKKKKKAIGKKIPEARDSRKFLTFLVVV